MSQFKSKANKTEDISKSSDLSIPVRSAQEYEFLYDPDASQSQQTSGEERSASEECKENNFV